MIALGTADFRDAVAECVSISGNPEMQFQCMKMLINAVTWSHHRSRDGTAAG